MQKITSLIYKIIAGHPGAVIAVIIASFLMSFGAFSHVEVDEDFEAGISDPQAIATRAEYRRHFGHEQAILLAFDIDGIDRNSLLTAWELADRIHSWPEVRQVLSILDVLRPFRRADEFAAYLKDFRIRNLVELLQNDRLFRGYLVSDDLKSLQILIVPDVRAPDYRRALYNHLKELQADMSGRVKLHVFGFPYIQERFFEFIVENNRRFLTLGLICCTLLAWYLFPDPLVLGLILLAIAAPTSLTFAVYFMNGNKINLFTSPIIPFALIISLNEIIYIVSFFVRERKNAHQNYAELHQQNYRRLIRPCLINTLTTLIGFLSLSQSPSPSIRLFSLYTSLACFFAYIVTFGLIFACFKLYQPKFSLRGSDPGRLRWLQRLVRNIVFRHPGKVLAVAAVSLLLVVPALQKFETRNALTDNFSAADPLLQAHAFISSRFCGPGHFQVMISAPDLMEPERLAGIAEFQKRVAAIPGINRVFSIVDLMLAFNKQFTGEAVLPATADLGRAVIDFFGQRGIADLLIAPDFSTTLLRVHTSLTDDFSIVPLRRQILAAAAAALPASLSVDVTGDVYLNALMQKSILENITWSFVAAVLMIIAVFYLVFRSLYLAFVALLVNFYPILLAYAAAGYFGLPLNPSTAVVGCVMSGLIVDDTLHLLTFLQENRQPTQARKVMAAIRDLAVPVSSSSLLLMLGNAIFMLSTFKPFTYFGLIGTLVVVIGLAGDLLVLPVLILMFGRQRKNAAVQSEPQRSDCETISL